MQLLTMPEDPRADRIILASVAPDESCCGSKAGPVNVRAKDRSWIVGSLSSSAGEIPRVATRLTWRDKLGHCKVRWNIGRMKYTIEPGLYAVGNPTSESPVFVSANFKMSFDRLRAGLDRLHGWIMVLDTRGINVWCAAGKGTFGTDEIIRRVATTKLDQVVSHRKLILPQLGAPGVRAHEVKKHCGFTVRYGPIRAQDIPAYLDNHLKATPDMRLVQFPLRHRLELVPADLLFWGKWALTASVALALLSGFGEGVYSFERVLFHGFWAAVSLFSGFLAGAVLTPVLLPWLPGRAFAVKGAFAGALFLLGLAIVWALTTGPVPSWTRLTATVGLTLALASFVGMNFTGSSTYTSLSGVKKEMKTAVPLQIAAAALGLGFWIAARWV